MTDPQQTPEPIRAPYTRGSEPFDIGYARSDGHYWQCTADADCGWLGTGLSSPGAALDEARRHVAKHHGALV